jgi:hypothetical protein
MKINHLGDLKNRDKSKLLVCVGYARQNDLFGDCDGVRLTIEQTAHFKCPILLVDLVIPAEEARSLGNRLIEAYIKVTSEAIERKLQGGVIYSDPFPGL